MAPPPNAATPSLSIVPRSLITVDLSTPDSQRALAAELGRVLDTRMASDRDYGGYLQAIGDDKVWEREASMIEILPELQLAVTRGLAVLTASGAAVNVLRKFALLPAGLHPDVLAIVGDLAMKGQSSARNFAVEASRLERPPKELFVGAVSSQIFASVANRRPVGFAVDCGGIIRGCSDFCDSRLRFLLQRDSTIPEEERAIAFAETLAFLARDVARRKGTRYEESTAVLERHKLMDAVNAAVAGVVTAPWGRVKRWVFKKSPPQVRIARLFPEVASADLINTLKEAFLKLPPSVRP